jgi:DNA-binding Lrp family transcriptional regulator
MTKAFVLINTETGHENEVIESLNDIKDVIEAHIVFGEYDIIALLDSGSRKDLNDIIRWKIRKHMQVKSTLTLVVI